jgi:hypothetical protein
VPESAAAAMSTRVKALVRASQALARARPSARRGSTDSRTTHLAGPVARVGRPQAPKRAGAPRAQRAGAPPAACVLRLLSAPQARGCVRLCNGVCYEVEDSWSLESDDLRIC